MLWPKFSAEILQWFLQHRLKNLFQGRVISGKRNWKLLTVCVGDSFSLYGGGSSNSTLSVVILEVSMASFFCGSQQLFTSWAVSYVGGGPSGRSFAFANIVCSNQWYQWWQSQLTFNQNTPVQKKILSIFLTFISSQEYHNFTIIINTESLK